MIQLPLSAIPNQSFSVVLNTQLYYLAIKLIGNVMAVDLSINNTIILLGMRAVAGYPIIPYSYLENGNFVFTNQNDDYPFYTQFGITQFLIYATQQELAALRASV